jgi:transporter family-2 protein
MFIIYIFLAIIVGIGFASQTVINAKLSITINSAMNAAFFSLMVSATTILFLKLFNWNISFSLIRTIPAWLYLAGGVIGALSVTILILITPKLGVSLAIAIMIAAQIIAALIFDHFGAFGMEVKQINFAKIIGVVFLLVGATICLYYR